MTKTDVWAVILGIGIAAYLYLKARWRWIQEMRYYATRTEPFIIASTDQNDEWVEERATEIRWMLAQSGNKWNPPVICHPYAKFREGSARYISFEDYLTEVDEIRRTARAQWQKKIEKADPDAYRQFVLSQHEN